MEVKWPFMLITVGLLFALGLTIATLERTSVMNNWTSRRCDLPVMMAAMFFKPTSDPRTKSDFAKDNFDFCAKSYVDKFMELFMAPINSLFGKQTNIVGGAAGVLSTIRTIATTLYKTLLSYLDTYFRRFNAAVYEMSRITQYLRMAMRRANAVVMSMLYSGISIFRGMINSIQFVIRVVMIIIGIMLAIIIILIFILFPFIPLILSVLGIVVATVLSLSLYMSASIAQQAENSKGGFCFSEKTEIIIKDNTGKPLTKSVKDIKIGDELGNNCGKVTAVILMKGKDVPLYNLNGILVSGTHLVKGTDGVWKSVIDDERAILSTEKSEILYCFNTTSHTIPVISSNTNVILFRDWEELTDDDNIGQIGWVSLVLKILNQNTNINKWINTIKVSENIPLISPNTKVKTVKGFVEVSTLSIDSKILTSDGLEQEVLGIVEGELENSMRSSSQWNTELFEFIEGVWKKGVSTVKLGKDNIQGKTIITESGEFIIWDELEQKEKRVRDFTDVGYKTIHETYSFVASRLRFID